MKKTLISSLFGLLITSLSQSATISWSFSEIVNIGSAQNTTGTGFLANDGALHSAANPGGIATTLDGIDFAAGGVNFGLNFTGFHASAATNPITGTATYSNSGPSTVTIGNGGLGADLLLGVEYRIQAIVMDGRGAQASRYHEIDGNVTDHALGTSSVTWGNALLATGTFVADADFQTFTSESFSSGGGSVGGQLNGIVVHVPEPSSVALLGLGGLALILRRRK